VETVSNGAYNWEPTRELVPLAATVHRKTQKSIGFRANEQLINRKRPGHCVRIVSQKSSAIVTVECGAETGVRDCPPASESHVIELRYDSGVLHVNQPYYRMLCALHRTHSRMVAMTRTIHLFSFI
jgi:hypothetical protein